MSTRLGSWEAAPGLCFAFNPYLNFIRVFSVFRGSNLSVLHYFIYFEDPNIRSRFEQ